MRRQEAEIQDHLAGHGGPALLLEEAPDAYIVISRSTGEILLANSLAEQLFGYESGELVERPVEVLVPEALRTNHEGHRDQYSAPRPERRPMGHGLDLVAIRKDGSEFPVDVSLSPMVWRDGPVVLIAIRDISDVLPANNALRTTLERYRNLFKRAPIMLCVCGRDERHHRSERSLAAALRIHTLRRDRPALIRVRRRGVPAVC